jgi:hypothetical protein
MRRVAIMDSHFSSIRAVAVTRRLEGMSPRCRAACRPKCFPWTFASRSSRSSIHSIYEWRRPHFGVRDAMLYLTVAAAAGCNTLICMCRAGHLGAGLHGRGL